MHETPSVTDRVEGGGNSQSARIVGAWRKWTWLVRAELALETWSRSGADPLPMDERGDEVSSQLFPSQS